MAEKWTRRVRDRPSNTELRVHPLGYLDPRRVTTRPTVGRHTIRLYTLAPGSGPGHRAHRAERLFGALAWAVPGAAQGIGGQQPHWRRESKSQGLGRGREGDQISACAKSAA